MPETSNGRTTDLTAERDRLVADLCAVVRVLRDYRDIVDDCPGAATIQKIAQEVAEESAEMVKEGRLLRLAIVGQIKAGKSTLLNLLLFGGREVLPTAATPMTVSLTHIVRSEEVGTEQAEIEVEYYTKDEWQSIVNHVGDYRKESETGRSPDGSLNQFHELVKLAEKRGLRISSRTGKDKRRTSIDNLNGHLCSLVGVEGTLAPLVKNVTIRCNEGVLDLDIVDTPGLNDPIRSRAQATRRLLATCDAVLLLSYAGQFMPSSDVELLQCMLPTEGIKRCLLIASKYDSALIDAAGNHGQDLDAADENVREKLRNRALDMIERHGEDGGGVHVAPEDVAFVFVSAICAILSGKKYAEWSERERGEFDALREAYPLWFDSPDQGTINKDTVATLSRLGGKENIDYHIATIRAQKMEVIEEKVRDYLQVKRTRRARR